MDTRVKPAYDDRARKSKRLPLVLHPLQDARRPAAADQSPDRRRRRRRHPDGDALCHARPQAGDCVGVAAGGVRAVAARNPVALSAGAALSAVGCRRAARRMASSCSAASIEADLSAAHGTPGRAQRARPHHRGGGAGASLSERTHCVLRRQRQSDFERCAGSRFRRRHLRKSRYRQVAPDHGAAFAQHA